jgi:putative redox protein
MTDHNFTVDFEGELITKAVHLFSGTTIKTDAPLDNNGKASSFSPTDLVSVALVSCMLSIIAIHYDKKGVALKPIHSKVKKVMASNPRRIAEIHIWLDFGANEFTREEYQQLERLAHACPVAQSLSKEIKIVTNFSSFTS